MPQVQTNATTDLNLWQQMQTSTAATAASSGNNSSSQTQGYKSTAPITRAANVTPYIAGDIYGGLFELTNFAAAGGHVFLNSVRIIFNISALPVGMAGFSLYLYSAPPPSAIADNAAFSLRSGDRSVILTPGGIDLGFASLAIGGGSVVLEANNLGLQFQSAPGQTSVWGYLVTRSGFTPAANSETATITALGVW